MAQIWYDNSYIDVCPLALLLPIPLNSRLLCSHPFFLFQPLSTQFSLIPYFHFLFLCLIFQIHTMLIFLLLWLIMMINLAPTVSLDAIFIAFLMLLREVNALRLIISVHEQSRAFQESVLVPGTYFSTHPFPDRTHVYQLSGHKCLFKPPIAGHGSDGISSKFNISLVLMVYLYPELCLCSRGASACLLRLPLNELIWPNSDT